MDNMGQSGSFRRNGPLTLNQIVRQFPHRFISISPEVDEQLTVIGKAKFRENVEKKKMQDRGAEPDLVKQELNQIMGVKGEYCTSFFYLKDHALAMKQLEHLDVKGSPDVGDNVGVRTRKLWEWACQVAPKDRNDLSYVLVTRVKMKVGLRYLIRGWITGKEAKEIVPLSNPTGRGDDAHWVPATMLYEPESLIVTGVR